MRILGVRRGFQADHSSSWYLSYAVDRPASAEGQRRAHRYSSRAEVSVHTARDDAVLLAHAQHPRELEALHAMHRREVHAGADLVVGVRLDRRDLDPAPSSNGRYIARAAPPSLRVVD